jgi:hypothetical protein
MKMKNNQYGFSHGMIILSIFLVLAIGFIGFRVYNRSNSSKTIASTSLNSTKTNSNDVGVLNLTAIPPLASGTDNASLNSNLSNINNSLSQENLYNSSIINGMNDSTSQISVPNN